MATASDGARALASAARVIKAGVAAAAGKFSAEIPAALRLRRTGASNWSLYAGRAGGEWGWTPIHAWMFEEPHAGPIPKHPLFGDRKKWYYQPYRPYLEEGAEATADDAMRTYADGCIAIWCKELGYE